MTAGYSGTFVVPWVQTAIDGIEDAPVGDLRVGAAWEWHGSALRIDGPDGVLTLRDPIGEAALRRRATRVVRKLLPRALKHSYPDTTEPDEVEVQQPLADSGFVVTNGAQVYPVALLEQSTSRAPLVVFTDGLPPKHTELWVSDRTYPRLQAPRQPHLNGPTGLLKGTQVMTELGPVAVEHLRPGDMVATRDAGFQPVIWTGAQRLGGGRLSAMPSLRPVCLHPGAVDNGVMSEGQSDLYVAPRQRVVMSDPAAQTLFMEDTVLVRAADLINDAEVRPLYHAPKATYIAVLLVDHHILQANGFEVESLHPAELNPHYVHPGDLAQFDLALSRAGAHKSREAPPVRRSLTQAETAMLSYGRLSASYQSRVSAASTPQRAVFLAHPS